MRSSLLGWLDVYLNSKREHIFSLKDISVRVYYISWGFNHELKRLVELIP